MYELVLRAPIRELYEGIAYEVAAIVEKRVRGLCSSYEKRPGTKARAGKIAHLKAILEDLAALRP